MKLRETGPVEGQHSRFNSMTALLEAEGADYLRGYCRGACALARQIEPTGALLTRTREAIRLNLMDHPDLLAKVEQDWGVW